MAKLSLSPDELRGLAQIAAECRYDPLLWAETAWQWGHGALAGHDIRYWQADVMDIIAKHLSDPNTRYDPLRIAVASGHGIGKSAGMGMLSNWAMSCWQGARVVVTANTEGQLRTKTSPEVGTWFRTSLSAPLFDIDTLSIKPRETSEVPWVMDFVPWSEHNTEAFAGLHAKDRIIVLMMDEASAIADKIWEVAEGAMTDENTVVIWLAFGNPTRNVGRFRECFRKFRYRWVTRQIDSRTVEGTNKKFLNELVNTYGEDSDLVKVRVRGQFPSASSRQLIPTHKVDAARGKHLQKSSYEFAPVILTCDPAWTGDDTLEIGYRQGLVFHLLESIPKNDNDVLIAGKLAAYEDRLKADAVFVDMGWGTGIVSVGKTMGRDWELVNFADKATTKAHANKRAEMWDAINDWLDAGGVIPDDDELYEDLIGVETKPTLNGSILLLSKEEMKKLQLPSPNKGDTLAMTFYRPVVKKTPEQHKMRVAGLQNQGHIVHSRYVDSDGEYNPHPD